MIKKHPHLMRDDDLKRLLKKYDAFAKPSQAFLAGLERSIFVQSGAIAQEAATDGAILPFWFTRQGWSIRAVALACTLILAVGFVVGVSSGGSANVTSAANIHSIVAMANEQSGDSSWDDDDGQ